MTRKDGKQEPKKPIHASAKPKLGAQGEASSLPLPVRKAPPKSIAFHGAKALGASFATLVFLLLVGGAGLYTWLLQGPINLDFLLSRVASALNERLGKDYHVTFSHIGIAHLTRGLQLQVSGLQILDARKQLVLQNDTAQMSVNPIDLLTGQFVPASLDLQNVSLHLTLLANGQVQVTSNATDNGAVLDAKPQPLTGALLQSRMTNALVALLQGTLSPNSPLHAVDTITVHQGRILVQDVALGRQFQLENVNIGILKQSDGIGMQISSGEPQRNWAILIDAKRHKLSQSGVLDEQPNLHIALKNFDLGALARWSGQDFGGAQLIAEVSVAIEASLDPQNHLTSATFNFASPKGMFAPSNIDAEPFLYDSIMGRAHIDLTNADLVVDRLALDSNGTHLITHGQIALPKIEGAPWAILLEMLPNSQIGVSRPGDQPIVISNANLSATFDTAQGLITLQKLNLQGPAIHMQGNGSFSGGAAPRLVLTGTIGSMPARNVVQLWPAFVAPPVRAWFRQRLTMGTIDEVHLALDFDAAALELLKAQKPAPDSAMQLEGRVHGVSLSALPDFPPISNLDAVGRLTGHTVHVDISRGAIALDPKNVMQIGTGTYIMPDTALKPAPATVTAQMSGSLTTTSLLLNSSAMRPFVKLPLDPANIDGKIDGKLMLDMMIGDHVAPNQTKVTIDAKVTGFVARNLIGKAGFDQAILTVKADAKGINASGKGRIFDSPATLTISQAPNKIGKAIIAFTLDNAARKKLKMGFPQVTGPVAVKIESPLVTAAKPASNGTAKKPANSASALPIVTLNLTNARIDNPVPGFNKAVGRPAIASFTVVADAKGTHLDKLIFDGGGVSVKGSADLTSDGRIASAHLTQVQLSSTDDMAATITPTAKGMQVAVTGAVFDARALLQSLLHGPASTKAAPPGADLDLDFKLNKVTGYNSGVLTNVSLRLSRRGGLVRSFQMDGHSESGVLTGSMQPGGQINVHSSDAGGMLAFLDFYRHMQGGTLDLSLNNSLQSTSGEVSVHKFVLQNEPMLRQIAASRNEGPSATAGDSNLNIADVPFEKLHAGFVIHAGQVDMKDAVIFGSQLGITATGRIAFPQNYMDLRGTFVPAYGLNNIFARIPLFGILLGGGKHEGLFAVNFRVSGPISGPTLNFNPISAIAPGFLRQIFGAGGVPQNFQPKAAQ